MQKAVYPMRINKYLALHKYCTRKAADELIQQGRVTINGRKAVLGDKVSESDAVEVRAPKQTLHYYMYNKPRGIITHSPQGEEKEIADIISLKGVFPVGRLDKDSCGLIILTDDGRTTDALLNPAHEHEKEYEVVTLTTLPPRFKQRMEGRVDIGGYRTKRSVVKLLGEKKFTIIITEGKKHQIRRMCGAFGQSTVELKRVRVMNIKLGGLKPGTFRAIEGAELETFLHALGITPQKHP